MMLPRTLLLFLGIAACPCSAFFAPLALQRGVNLAALRLNSGLQQQQAHHEDTNVSEESSSLQQQQQQRRTFLTQLGALLATTTAVAATPVAAMASDDSSSINSGDEMIEVYFGCGCFWHVQHEFVQAERDILGRNDDSALSARAGYAGGKAADKICYHNAANTGDYGALGHAEVVQVTIPASKLYDFSLEYCKLFSSEGYRPDQAGDRGSEYRNLVGVPGGADSKYAKTLVKASQDGGDKLDFAKGKGATDPDRRALVFVMDSTAFPFRVAEQYHQFHDGFNLGENYPQSYNGLASKLAKEDKLGTSSCPNGLLGLGALGL